MAFYRKSKLIKYSEWKRVESNHMQQWTNSIENRKKYLLQKKARELESRAKQYDGMGWDGMGCSRNGTSLALLSFELTIATDCPLPFLWIPHALLHRSYRLFKLQLIYKKEKENTRNYWHRWNNENDLNSSYGWLPLGQRSFIQKLMHQTDIFIAHFLSTEQK